MLQSGDTSSLSVSRATGLFAYLHHTGLGMPFLFKTSLALFVALSCIPCLVVITARVVILRKIDPSEIFDGFPGESVMLMRVNLFINKQATGCWLS
jgi:hypothetical protein